MHIFLSFHAASRMSSKYNSKFWAFGWIEQKSENCFVLQEPVLRKVDSAIHRIVIFSTLVKNA